MEPIDSDSSLSLHTISDTSSIDEINFDPFGYTDNQLTTGLIAAIHSNDLNLVKQCLDKGLNINYADNKGNTALHYACYYKQVSCIELLLYEGSVRMDVENFQGETVLMALFRNWGTSFSDIDAILKIMKTLINGGCDVNHKSNLDYTTLLCAIEWLQHTEYAHLDVLNFFIFLLESEADLNVENYIGRTPLLLLLNNKFLSNLREELLHMFLYYNVDVNYVNQYGLTAFAHSVNERTLSCANILIDFVCDIEVDSNSRYPDTPLYISLENRSEYWALKLLENGADVNVQQELYKSYLNLALRLSSPKIFDYLLANTDKKIFLRQEYHRLFYQFMEFCEFSKTDYMKYMRILLEHKYMPYFTIDCYDSEDDIFRKLIYMFTKLDFTRNERRDTLYLLLTYLNEITPHVILECYDKFGFNDELDALLKVSRVIHTDCQPCRHWYPVDHITYQFLSPNADVSLLLAEKYRTLFRARCQKSLVQIARDAIRRHLKCETPQEHYDISYYNNIYKQLPKILADIIVLKTNIY